MSFRNPNLSFHNAGNGSVSVCETVCICVCVCVFAAFLEIPVKSEAGARYYLMSFCSESHLGF